MVAEDDKEFTQIARCMWEATGYRFTSVWFPLEAIELIFHYSIRFKTKLPQENALPKECMSTANLRLIPTIERRDPGWSLVSGIIPSQGWGADSGRLLGRQGNEPLVGI